MDMCITKFFFFIKLILLIFILLVKFHIHKCIFSNKTKKNCFRVFYNKLENYPCNVTIQHSTNRKAIKTVRLCSIFTLI